MDGTFDVFIEFERIDEEFERIDEEFTEEFDSMIEEFDSLSGRRRLDGRSSFEFDAPARCTWKVTPRRRATSRFRTESNRSAGEDKSAGPKWTRSSSAASLRLREPRG